MPFVAETIIALLLKYGPAAVEQIITLIQSKPNPTADDWLALLRHPSLTLTYDQQVEAAEVRAAGKA